MANPRASILITAYNYEKYVEECILSCLGQNFPSFEVILVDDGSRDQTLAIAQKYAGQIQILSGPNQGVEAAANRGIRAARGEFLVRVDADDKLLPDYLRVMVPALENSSAAFAYSEYEVIDGASRVLHPKTLPDFSAGEVYARGDFLATGTLYRKALIERAGLYSEQKRNCGLENYELVLRLLAEGAAGLCVHQNLFQYRVHGANMSETRRADIISFGRSMEGKWGLRKYQTNEFHPHGLRLDS